VISPSATVHPSAIVGVDGMRWIRNGKTLIRMKHMGNVILHNDVEVGPLTVIHRGTIDATEIGSRTKIGSNVSIGHNVQIACDTMITAGVIIGGSARIGKGCWLGIGSKIRDNITVYQNIRIGMGAVVTRDLKQPGTYVGCPATRIGDWDGSL
jgi:UDP-3-O-[3-hydroxymyristoyl] glucosamine N-acyltransferase